MPTSNLQSGISEDPCIILKPEQLPRVGEVYEHLREVWAPTSLPAPKDSAHEHWQSFLNTATDSPKS